MEEYYFAHNEHTRKLDRISASLAKELRLRNVDAKEVSNGSYYINNIVTVRIEDAPDCRDILFDVEFGNVHGDLLDSLIELKHKISPLNEPEVTLVRGAWSI